MASVVTVMNMKGGVGKTVISAHLAGMLARYVWGNKQRKVLLIDYDPQFNLSQMFLPAKLYFSLEQERRTSQAILQDDEATGDPFKLKVPGNHAPPDVDSLVHPIYKTGKGGVLDLIPSTLDLMYLALGQLRARTTVFEERFQKFIAACRQKYDVVIIDCHPAGSLLTKTSLDNSDHVLIPVVSTSPFAGRGVGLMKRFLLDSQSNAKAHILFNLWRTTSPYEQSIRNDPSHQNDCFSNVLRVAKAFSDPAEGKGFVWVSKKPYSTMAFRSLYTLTAEVVRRLGL